jgi:hypothetical protein
VGQPSPTDEASSADAGGYFLTSYFCSRIEIPGGGFQRSPIASPRTSQAIKDAAKPILLTTAQF